ncbi:hypothetical protein [Maricaulis parjimensis]|uniref:hypothetical protein n=1 Tax=Maricaulis parjimensis TaxID=144023 RepID=UPI00193A5978|nr:hypothetical protein [Maricaulis parjimensis]
MILSRITLALREQNWLAVAIEFVIVILGVVIGFQISSWNQVQADRRGETELLHRLHNDLLVLAEGRDQLSPAYGGLLERVLIARRALLSETPSAGLEPEICAALAASHDFDQPPDSLPTIEELIATGRMDLIRDDGVREQALSTLQLRDFARSVRQNLFEAQVSLMSAHPEHFELSLETRPDGRESVRIECNLDSMRADPAFLADIVLNTRGLTDFVSFPLGFVDMHLDRLHAEVDEALGLETGHPHRGETEATE